MTARYPIPSGKFRAHPQPPHSVRRILALEEISRRALAAPCLYMQGPAGSGKSTLAGQYALQCGHAVVWLRLDEADNSPQRLLLSLCWALNLSDLENTFLADEAIYGTDLLRALAQWAETLSQPLLVILDNLDKITDMTTLRALALLIEYMPKMVNLLLLSRRGVPAPLMRLDMEGRLSRLSPSILAFHPQEALALAGLNGFPDSQEQAENLCFVTGGWSLGVSRASTLPKAAGDIEAQLLNSGLAQYLYNEEYTVMPLALREYASRIAALPIQSAELCAQLTALPDSEGLLAALRHDEAFLTSQGDGFAFTPLYRAFLFSQLSPDIRIETLAEASRVCLRAGKFQWAVELAMRAGRRDMMQQALESMGLRLISTGSSKQVQEWIAYLEKEGSLPPWAQLAKGACLLRCGQPAEAAPILASARDMYYRAGDAERYWRATLFYVGALRWSARMDEAEKLLLSMMRSRETLPTSMYQEAAAEYVRILLQTGRIDSALELASQEDWEPGSGVSHTYALTLFYQGDYRGCAAALYQIGEAPSPGWDARILLPALECLQGRPADFTGVPYTEPAGIVLTILHTFYPGVVPPSVLRESIANSSTRQLLAELIIIHDAPYIPAKWDAMIDRLRSAHCILATHAALLAAEAALAARHADARQRAQACIGMAQSAHLALYVALGKAMLAASSLAEGNMGDASTGAAELAAYLRKHMIEPPTSLKNALNSLPSLAGAIPASPLYLRCFGSFEAIPQDELRLPIKFRTRKTQELLCYFVHRAGEEIHRDEILAALWPELSAQQARSLFHTSLYNLRKALDPYGLEDWIRHENHAYHLRLDVVASDLSALEPLLTRAGGMPAEDLLAQADALSLYAGSYMESLSGDWHIARQTRFEQQAIGALRRIGEILVQSGRCTEALEYLRRAVALDPFNELWQTRLIACYVELGNRTAAIRQYRTLWKLLKDELGVAPEPHTQNRICSLLGGDPLAVAKRR